MGPSIGGFAPGQFIRVYQEGTAMKLPASTSYWTTPAFGNSKAFAPAVVVIMLGTNDSKTAIWKGGNNSYEADYRSLLATYAALPSKLVSGKRGPL